MVKLTLTHGQQVAISAVPKFTASLSMLGSSYIIYHVLVNPNRRRRVYHRILLGMGLMDVISSFKFFLSTWPSPRGTAWGAVGTTGTCAAAGFFGHGSSLAGPLYNGSLALYYYLTICNRSKWREERLRSLEKWLHAVPLVLGWSTAIAGLPLKLYNPIGWTCWIGPWPMGCKQTYEWGYTTCDRGDNSYIYRWAFFHGELWLTFLLTFVSMILICSAVWRRERMAEFSPSARRLGSDELRSSLQHERKHSRRVIIQAVLYVAAFYLTWIFPAVTWLIQLVQGKTFTIILFLQAIFVPLQGLFNVMIYLRPRYIRNREQYPNKSLRSILWRTLKSEAPRRARPSRPSTSSRSHEKSNVIRSSSTFFGASVHNMFQSFRGEMMRANPRNEERDHLSNANGNLSIIFSSDGDALEGAGIQSAHISSVKVSDKEEWKDDDDAKDGINDKASGNEDEEDISEELVD